MKRLSYILIILLFNSCAGYRTTKFTPDSLNLGVDIEYVINKYGNPFKTDIYVEDKVLCKILYYKEVVDVSSYTYIVTTILRFNDSVLVNIEHLEEILRDGQTIKIVPPAH